MTHRAGSERTQSGGIFDLVIHTLFNRQPRPPYLRRHDIVGRTRKDNLAAMKKIIRMRLRRWRHAITKVVGDEKPLSREPPKDDVNPTSIEPVMRPHSPG